MTTTSDQGQPQSRRRRPALWVVACVVAFGLAVVAVVFAFSGPGPTDPLSKLGECQSQARAKTTVIRFVDDPIVERRADVAATIVGLYDTYDNLGRPVRGVYQCRVAKDSDGHFQLIRVTVTW